MNRRTLRVRDCGTWPGSIDDIIATAAYLEKAGYQQEAGQHVARKGGTGYVQVLYRCSLTLIGKKQARACRSDLHIPVELPGIEPPFRNRAELRKR